MQAELEQPYPRRGTIYSLWTPTYGSVHMCSIAGTSSNRVFTRESIMYSDIPHIRLRVSKEPAILHDGDGRGIHERRQLSHRAHKTISRCRELASARRRQLSARLHMLQLIQAHSSPLATPFTSDDPKDTRYPSAGWSPPIRSSTCHHRSVAPLPRRNRHPEPPEAPLPRLAETPASGRGELASPRS